MVQSTITPRVLGPARQNSTGGGIPRERRVPPPGGHGHPGPSCAASSATERAAQRPPQRRGSCLRGHSAPTLPNPHVSAPRWGGDNERRRKGSVTAAGSAGSACERRSETPQAPSACKARQEHQTSPTRTHRDHPVQLLLLGFLNTTQEDPWGLRPEVTGAPRAATGLWSSWFWSWGVPAGPDTTTSLMSPLRPDLLRPTRLDPTHLDPTHLDPTRLDPTA